jgi:hypothetical protein
MFHKKIYKKSNYIKSCQKPAVNKIYPSLLINNELRNIREYKYKLKF